MSFLPSMPGPGVGCQLALSVPQVNAVRRPAGWPALLGLLLLLPLGVAQAAAIGNSIQVNDMSQPPTIKVNTTGNVSVTGDFTGALAFGGGLYTAKYVNTKATDTNFLGLLNIVSVPVLTSVAPNPGGLGQTITLTGTDLSNPTALTINGADALAGIVSNSGTSVVVRVPVSAAATGNVSLTTSGGTATSAFTVMAPPGNALAFDGANDYLSLPSGLNTANFTFEAWVNYQDNGVFTRIFDFGSNGNTWMMLTPRTSYAGNVGYLGFGIVVDRSTAPEANILSTTPLAVGRWQHVAVTLAATTNGGTSGTLYLNGKIIGTNPNLAVSPVDLGTLTNNWLGRSQYSTDPYLKASLDEVHIWNTARTQAQVQADMLAPATTPFPAGLQFYLNTDQGTPATLSTGDNTGLTTLYDLVSATPVALANFALASGNTTSNYVASYALVVPTTTAATATTATGFTANWTAPVVGTVTSYVVDVSTAANFSMPVTGSPFTVAATSLSVTGLTRSTTYYYQVRALNSNLAVPDQGAFSAAMLVATPLPVTLAAFAATAEGAAVRLAWATATETNSAFFEVERSTDGTTFAAIGKVAAAGSSGAYRAYALLDTKLPTAASVLYYRLRQVDHAGAYAYSPVRTLAVGSKSANGLALVPNPARRTTLTGAQAGASVAVYDALGRLVLTATADAVGTVALTLPATLPTGMYVVRTGTHAVRLVVE